MDLRRAGAIQAPELQRRKLNSRPKLEIMHVIVSSAETQALSTWV